MTRLIDYTVASDKDLQSFIQECKYLVSRGWKTVGSVSTCQWRVWDEYGKADRDYVFYSQAFVREEESYYRNVVECDYTTGMERRSSTIKDRRKV